jgi:hypothetical protein
VCIELFLDHIRFYNDYTYYVLHPSFSFPNAVIKVASTETYSSCKQHLHCCSVGTFYDVAHFTFVVTILLLLHSIKSSTLQHLITSMSESVVIW